MNDRFLFRGIAVKKAVGYNDGENVDIGEFAYGHLINTGGTREYYENCGDFESYDLQECWYITDSLSLSCSVNIDYKTIGQYTGKKDKDGTLIFEGDLVNIFYDDGEFFIIEDCYLIVAWCEKNLAWVLFDDKDNYYGNLGDFCSERIKIAGNIHEVKI